MKGFEGWYFKHQRGKDMLAFIPGRAESGAFVQMITSRDSRQFPVDSLNVEGGVIRAGDCVFSPGGRQINLPGIRGEIDYGAWQPLSSDIMGPFRFLPMECRHGVLSMDHFLRGGVEIGGEVWNFDGGRGYVETDRGVSFPSGYLWMQCNTFPEECGVMVSVARIPFCGRSFRGCICALIYGGKEYRFATYCGVRILAFSETHICLKQGSFLLELDMQPAGRGHLLAAPADGQMSAVIRECCNADLRLRLWEDSRKILGLSSSTAAYEYVPGKL